MKVILSQAGNLEIQRMNGIRMQYCFHQHGMSCGDWCPLFCEPQIHEEERVVELQICKRKFVVPVNDFKDNRTY